MLTSQASAYFVEVLLRDQALLTQIVHALKNDGLQIDAHPSFSHVHSHWYLNVILRDTMVSAH